MVREELTITWIIGHKASTKCPHCGAVQLNVMQASKVVPHKTVYREDHDLIVYYYVSCSCGVRGPYADDTTQATQLWHKAFRHF